MSAPQPVQGAWVVHPGGMTLEDISANFAPAGALVDALMHSPKKTGVGPPVPVGPRVVMTPHSAEACLIEGVDPRDLYQRPLESFTWGAHADRSVAQMRLDIYNKLREDKLARVTSTRAALLRGELPRELGVSAAAAGGVLASAAPAARSPRAHPRAAVDSEAHRLARLQLRQQRELAQLVACEVRALDGAEAAEEKKRADDSRVEDRSAALAARKRAEQEERKMRDLKRRLQEEEQARIAREIVAEARRKDAAQAAMEKAKAEQLERDRLEKDLLRKQRDAEHEREAKRKEAEASARALQRQAELATAEADRQAALRARNEARLAAAEVKRAEAEARIAANKAAAAAAAEAVAAEAARRAGAAEARRAAREAAALAEVKARAMEAHLEEQRRALTAAQAAKDDDTRQALLELRLAAEEEARARALKEEARFAMLKREKGVLEEAAKHDGVERARAKDAYRRLVTLRAIEGKMAAGEERARTKSEAARIRRDMSARALAQKHRVLAAMRGMRGAGDLSAVQHELSSIMERGVSDIHGSVLSEAVRAAASELRGGASPRAGAAGAAGASPATVLPPLLTGGGSARAAAAASAAAASAAAFTAQPGVSVSMDAVAAAANAPPPEDSYSFLVAQPPPRGSDLLAGGAGLMWGGMGAGLGTGTAGATPGAAGAPTGLFFQTGPAMHAFLAARVGAGGAAAATPSAALGLGAVGGYGAGAGAGAAAASSSSSSSSSSGRGFRSYTSAGLGEAAQEASRGAQG